MQGTAVAWDALGDAVARADVVVCCTSGQNPVLDEPLVRHALENQPKRERLFVDLAVPRGVASDVAGLDGVTLLNIEDVAAYVASRLDERRREVPAVERIVTEELERFSCSVAARLVAPLVSKLHEQAEEVRQSELLRLKARLSHLGPAEQEELDIMTRRIVSKLLHEPTVTLKAASGTAKGEVLAEAFRELFGIQH